MERATWCRRWIFDPVSPMETFAEWRLMVQAPHELSQPTQLLMCAPFDLSMMKRLGVACSRACCNLRPLS